METLYMTFYICTFNPQQHEVNEVMPKQMSETQFEGLEASETKLVQCVAEMQL